MKPGSQDKIRTGYQHKRNIGYQDKIKTGYHDNLKTGYQQQAIKTRLCQVYEDTKDRVSRQDKDK